VLALVARLGVDTLELASELLADEDDALADEPSFFLLFFVWRRRDDLRLSADVASMSAKIIQSSICLTSYGNHTISFWRMLASYSVKHPKWCMLILDWNHIYNPLRCYRQINRNAYV